MQPFLCFWCVLTFTRPDVPRRPAAEPLVFVASTPCDAWPRTLLGIPADADSEFIKWTLTLYRDAQTQTPTTYTLRYTYGRSQPGTEGFLNGGTNARREGTWVVRPGTGRRVVIQLNPGAASAPISFLKLDDHLLHLLDADGNLMIGHAGWSYTLNRKSNSDR